MNTEFQFADAVNVREVPPPLIHRYFILAWWGRGGWWSIKDKRYESADCDAIKRDIENMRENGWSHIRICKLPEVGK